MTTILTHAEARDLVEETTGCMHSDTCDRLLAYIDRQEALNTVSLASQEPTKHLDSAMRLLLKMIPTVKLWVCPLHIGPLQMMATVEWQGDEATCLLCGFTNTEHARYRAAAIAAIEAKS